MPTETSALEHVLAAFDCYNSSNDDNDWWEIDSSEYTNAITERKYQLQVLTLSAQVSTERKRHSMAALKESLISYSYGAAIVKNEQTFNCLVHSFYIG